MDVDQYFSKLKPTYLNYNVDLPHLDSPIFYLLVTQCKRKLIAITQKMTIYIVFVNSNSRFECVLNKIQYLKGPLFGDIAKYILNVVNKSDTLNRLYEVQLRHIYQFFMEFQTKLQYQLPNSNAILTLQTLPIDHFIVVIKATHIVNADSLITTTIIPLKLNVQQNKNYIIFQISMSNDYKIVAFVFLEKQFNLVTSVKIVFFEMQYIANKLNEAPQIEDIHKIFLNQRCKLCNKKLLFPLTKFNFCNHMFHEHCMYTFCSLTKTKFSCPECKKSQTNDEIPGSNQIQFDTNMLKLNINHCIVDDKTNSIYIFGVDLSNCKLFISIIDLVKKTHYVVTDQAIECLHLHGILSTFHLPHISNFQFLLHLSNKIVHCQIFNNRLNIVNFLVCKNEWASFCYTIQSKKNLSFFYVLECISSKVPLKMMNNYILYIIDLENSKYNSHVVPLSQTEKVISVESFISLSNSAQEILLINIFNRQNVKYAHVWEI